jgi:hypothetical protein
MGAGKKLLREDKVHHWARGNFGVTEVKGVKGQGCDAPPGENQLFFLMFFTFPEIQDGFCTDFDYLCVCV